ncbi:hypothetical protein PMO31116_04174 [Pandoraea morbifera]|uniref:DUF1488 domain-containing protein n=1 Tax=Pandoraea morbifera TaxID=2508300 RepID=A0A5E4Y1H5_9BURK|nr:hypothetical protein [Pandoraea morbifera]VVE42168.1 hypothetical protein PMO31116_04174 [Pandoraea morbifera]
MDPFLHGGIGLVPGGEFVRFNVNVDGKVWTCHIARASLNRLANAADATDATDAQADDEALFERFETFEEEIVQRAAHTILHGAGVEPVVVDVA